MCYDNELTKKVPAPLVLTIILLNTALLFIQTIEGAVFCPDTQDVAGYVWSEISLNHTLTLELISHKQPDLHALEIRFDHHNLILETIASTRGTAEKGLRTLKTCFMRAWKEVMNEDSCDPT
jgi:hypothetical protein